MKIRLNPEAVTQLTWIMDHMDYTNPTHLIQVMLSSTYNKLNKPKHTSPNREDRNKHGSQTSKTVRNM